MRFERLRACRDCPMKRKSLGGYVGPYGSADEMIAVAKEGPYACHMGPGNGDPSHPQATQCYGAAVMANKSAHISRNPDVAEYQRQVGKTDRDTEEIMDQWECKTYHDSMGGRISSAD